MLGAFILQAIGLFIATNIDDIIVLSLFLPAALAAPAQPPRLLPGNTSALVPSWLQRSSWP